MLTPQEVESYFSQIKVVVIRVRGDWRDARCPWHDDKSCSFSFNVKSGGWKCHAGCGAGGLKEAAERSGVPSPCGAPARTATGAGELECTYDYKDEQGELIYQVLRYKKGNSKTFRQRRPDGNGGWVWKMDGVRALPYRLPELLAAGTAEPKALAFVAEGEKDVEKLLALGLSATTNHGGAGKWRDEHARHLTGRRVVVLPDNDAPGLKHAAQVAESLRCVAVEVRVLELPGLPPKGDVSDWIAAGGTREKLLDAAARAPLWDAPPADVALASALPGSVSEDALALEFTRRHRDHWRYVATWSRWMHWTDGRWVKEDTLKVFDLARAVCRSGATLGPVNEHRAQAMASASTVSAVERLARADRAHAATVEQWDADDWLLNTPGGIVDLQIGGVSTQRADASMTKMTCASARGSSPLWLEFLRVVTNGDDELAAYLARVAGYALTGSTREHALFFFHGQGLSLARPPPFVRQPLHHADERSSRASIAARPREPGHDPALRPLEQRAPGLGVGRVRVRDPGQNRNPRR